MIKRKLFAALLILAAVFALAMPSGALAARTWFEIEGENASVAFQKAEEYTFVTPETLNENLDLCLSHGGTEKAARERFATGHVVWEAYHPKLEGRIRLEVYEDEWTHYAWDSQTMSVTLMKKLGDDLIEAAWLGDHYTFLSLNFKMDGEIKFLTGRFNSVPPYDYESGRCAIHFYNGKAFMYMYADSKAASTVGLWSEQARDILEYGESMLRDGDFFRRDSKALANAPQMTDLLPDRSQWVLNLNSGAFTLTGITERGASVTLEAGGQAADAKVDEREYKGSVTLREGDEKIVVRAKKGDQPENVIQLAIPAVTDSKAMLVLSQYPFDYVDRAKLSVKGLTNPAGTVTVTVDGGEPIRAEVKADGSFEAPYEAEDWIEHTMVITASQEGKEDCAVELSFIPTYEDPERGASAYRKTLDEWVRPQDLCANPEDYVGKRLTYEIKVENWTTQNGIVTMMASLSDRKDAVPTYKEPICLIFNTYADDFFSVGRQLTVLGEMLTPTLTDPSYPRMQVEYAYLVIGGRAW